MIKAVIFDYFGVICSDEYWRFVKQDRQADTVFREYADDVNLGHIGWQEFVQKIAEATGKSVESVNSMYANERINPLSVGLITKLHKKYKTALLTNAHHDYIDRMLEEAHLGEIFDDVVISSKVGMIKPDPRIFIYTLEKLGVRPSEAVFIDDLTRHLEAAKQLGIKTIQYQNFEQLEKDLKSFLDLTDING